MNEILEVLTPKEIGSRLQLVRQRLCLTQKEVAKEIGITPLKISKIEAGTTITTPDFIKLLAYYSQSVSLDVLFAEKIDFVSQENLINKSFVMSKAVKEKLTLLKINTKHTILQMNDDILQTLDEAISLL